ncbi:MAG: class I SAM-dependent methyltransferase [Spirochaetes bacterium]|nr:class I SAM-dependent methyltransferase [Spirochaetota bacterium]
MKFREQRFAVEYDRRMRDLGYPGNILPLIMEKTASCRSIIDIGAGTGLLAIPLAQAGHRVIAVEPSGAMVAILRRNAAGRSLDAITISQETWESWTGEPADCVICVHSVYSLRPLSEALKKMKSKAPRVILVIGDDRGSSTLSGALLSRLSAPPRRRQSASNIRKAIRELSFPHTEEPIEQFRTHRIDDLMEEADFYRYSHDLDGISADKIADALRHIMTAEGSRYTFISRYADILLEF